MYPLLQLYHYIINAVDLEELILTNKILTSQELSYYGIFIRICLGK